MNEHKFVSNIRKSLSDRNIWSTILIDGSDFSTRPCDLIICNGGRLVAVEAKFQRGFSAFGIKHIRDSQVLNLDFINQGGGMGFIFLNVFIPHKENRLIAWEWENFKRITANGTIKKKELETMSFIQGKKNRFDATQILSVLNKLKK